MTDEAKTKKRIRRIWDGIIRRCDNPNAGFYHRYGGRGITVCDEWRDFEVFYKWALHNGYKDDLTIDRIDNDGNYEPSNCRWATWKEQANNKSLNHILTFDGKSQTMTLWAEETGITRSAIKTRLKNGWSVEKALTTPIGVENSMHHQLEFNGKTQNAAEWSREIGIPYSTIMDRINMGWETERILTTPEDARLRQISYKGKTQSIRAWAEELGLSYQGIAKRIESYGWSPEKAFETPFREKDIPIEFNGMTKTLAEWAEYLGIKWSTLNARIKRDGWSIEKALSTPVDTKKNWRGANG